VHGRDHRRRIKRVVIASDDPTEKAAGRGLGILRDEGIQVDVCDGDIAQAARLINQPFRKHARTGRPLVLLKYAMTLDGKVATRTGDSKWISSESSRARAHRWRAEADPSLSASGPRRPTTAPDCPRRGRRAPAAARDLRLRGASSADQPARRERLRGPVILVCSRAASRTTPAR